jgi:hypothetical protein
MAIRKRRRDRTRSRIANQKRLDAIALTEIGKSMWASAETWSGTICPDCNKSLPARAFCAGYHARSIDQTCIVSVGTSVDEKFCHADKSRCHHESATQKDSNWKLANDYIPNKKELKKLKKKREYWFKKKREYWFKKFEEQDIE